MIEISTKLVRQLIDTQFPTWKELDIYPVMQSGNDNRTFHLGGEMTIRLPSDVQYVAQVEKEAKWLPFLAKQLSLPISCPVEIGQPSEVYPFPWSINKYINGETVNKNNIINMNDFANDLSIFLKELQSIETKDAPIAGKHNFFRGANPIVYNEEVENALEELKEYLPIDLLREIWKDAISSQWQYPPVWIHGDIAPGNLLVENGKLSGVIDFGIMGIGDPACDYAMAWTFFDNQSRTNFLQGLDYGVIARARGWALWKALITYHDSSLAISNNAQRTIKEIIDEYK